MIVQRYLDGMTQLGLRLRSVVTDPSGSVYGSESFIEIKDYAKRAFALVMLLVVGTLTILLLLLAAVLGTIQRTYNFFAKIATKIKQTRRSTLDH